MKSLRMSETVSIVACEEIRWCRISLFCTDSNIPARLATFTTLSKREETIEFSFAVQWSWEWKSWLTVHDRVAEGIEHCRHWSCRRSWCVQWFRLDHRTVSHRRPKEREVHVPVRIHSWRSTLKAMAALLIRISKPPCVFLMWSARRRILSTLVMSNWWKKILSRAWVLYSCSCFTAFTPSSSLRARTRKIKQIIVKPLIAFSVLVWKWEDFVTKRNKCLNAMSNDK